MGATGKAGRIAALLAAGATLLLASAASGALGDLTQLECFADGGGSGCTDPGPDSLAGARGVATSPDGRSVYVVATNDASITHFTRNPDTGALTSQSCIADGGGSGCTNPSLDPLLGAAGVAVSPDGRSVYVTSVDDDSIAHFTRNTATGPTRGELTFQSCIAEGGSGGCDDPGAVDSLDGAFDVVVSPDGRNVYTTAQSDDSLTAFTRAADGTLAFQSCVAMGAASGCGLHPALDLAQGIAMSPDGEGIYVASLLDGAISAFSRDAATGVLTGEGCHTSTAVAGCATLVPMFNAADVAVSPDGNNVYVASGADSVTSFTRASGSSIAFLNCFTNAGAIPGCLDPPNDSLGSATGIAVSGDGQSVYVAALGGDAITHLGRGVNGVLVYRNCVAEAGANGCADPLLDSIDEVTAVAVPPDGGNIYATSRIDNSVTTLTRSTLVDATPPNVTITSPAVGSTADTTPTFGFTADEPVFAFTCRIYSGAPPAFSFCSGPGSSHTPPTALAPGTYTFEVGAVDLAGNGDSTPASESFTVLAPPVSSPTPSPGGATPAVNPQCAVLKAKLKKAKGKKRKKIRKQLKALGC